MAERKYRVVREHFGDKQYFEGDVRTAEEADVQHLVGRVLEPMAAAKKPPARKAAAKPKAAPAPRKRKG